MALKQSSLCTTCLVESPGQAWPCCCLVCRILLGASLDLALVLCIMMVPPWNNTMLLLPTRALLACQSGWRVTDSR